VVWWESEAVELDSVVTIEGGDMVATILLFGLEQ
jgi:hypothetical protein